MRVLDRFRHYLHPLRSIDENARFGAAQLERIASLLASERVDRLRREVRADPKRLAGYGYRGYSQNDEDGILQEIFRRIGITNRTFIEFGCGHGMENNTIYLLQSGWRGAWLDAGEQNIVSARNLHSGLLSTGKLSVAQAMITAENIDETLVRCAPESSIDLLSIDIDGNDYWIWKEIRSINARVVVIEYNATFRPPIDIEIQPLHGT